MGEKSKSTNPLEAPQAKRAQTIDSIPVVDLTEQDPPRPLSPGVPIQEEPFVDIGAIGGIPPQPPIDPSDFINIQLSPPCTTPPPPTTSSAPSNSSATMSDPVIRDLINGDHGAKVGSSTAVVPPVNPAGDPQVTFSDLITKMAQIVADTAGTQPEPTPFPQTIQTD